jgi:hypothetical protein
LSSGYSSGDYIQIASDASSRPLTLSTPFSLSSGGDAIILQGGVALAEYFDIIFKADLAAPSTIGIKLKLLGDSYSESKAGNFVLSITGAVGTTPWAEGQGDQDGLFGPGGNGWHWNSSNETLDGAVIAGYRLTEVVLVYGGTFYSKYWFNADIHQDPAVNGSSGAADFIYGGSGLQTGYNLGLEFRITHHFFIMAEAYYSFFQWTNIPAQPQSFGGAGKLGFAL